MISTSSFQIRAADPDSGDNGRLLFTFCDPSDPVVTGRFHIGEARGDLSLLFSPDREERKEYAFQVCVRDHGEAESLSAVTDVRVVIQDVNDCQPAFDAPQGYQVSVQVSNDPPPLP